MALFTPLNLISDQLKECKTLDNLSDSNFSIIESTTDFIIESNSSMNEERKKFYKTVLESNGEEEIITEAFSNLITTIKKYIDKFIIFIKKLFNRFVNALNNIVKSDNYLKKHQIDFSKFNKDTEFEFRGFKFTIDDDTVPMISVCTEYFNKEFLSVNLSNMTDDKSTLEEIESMYNDFKQKIENNKIYDDFRGEVLNKNTSISMSSFNEECFKIFRNDSLTADDITIDSEALEESKIRYFNYNKQIIENIKKTSSEIEKQYNLIKEKIDSLDKAVKNKDIQKFKELVEAPVGKHITLTDEIATILEKMISFKINQIQTMSGIHSVAFSNKISAVTECLKQDKQILYKALDRIIAKNEGCTITIKLDGDDDYEDDDHDDDDEKENNDHDDDEKENNDDDHDEVLYDASEDDEEPVISTTGEEGKNIEYDDSYDDSEEEVIDIDSGEEPAEPEEFDYELECCNDKLITSIIREQAELEQYINESIIISSDIKPSKKIAKINSMTEGAVTRNIKEFTAKVKEFIKKILNKFSEKMNYLFAKESKYLNKYKDIILKKEVVEAQLSMRNYSKGIKELTSLPVVLFNYEQMKNDLQDEFTFRKSIIGNRQPVLTEKDDFTTYCKNLFRGGAEEEEISSKTLNMTDIFNYCIKYNEYRKIVERDAQTIEVSADNAVRLIEKATADANKNVNNNTDKTAQDESCISLIYGSLNELTIKNNSSEKTQTSDNNNNSSGTASNDISKNANDIVGTGTDEDNAKATDDIEKLNKAVDIYLNTTRSIFAAKLTAAEEIFQSYMKIIRWHVGNYIDNGANSKSQQTGTSYDKEGKQSADKLGLGDDKIRKLGFDKAKEVINKSGMKSNEKESTLSYVKYILNIK